MIQQKSNPFIRQARIMARYFRPTTWRLIGEERHSGEEISVVIASNEGNKNYLQQLIFAKPPAEQNLERKWLHQVLPAKEHIHNKKDHLIFTELDEFQRLLMQSRYHFSIPCWIGGDIEFEKVQARIKKSKNAKEDLRRMRRDQVTYEITHSLQDYERFYNDMYHPYIKKTFGNCTFLMSYDDLINKFNQTELMLIKIKGEAVAGQVIIYEKNRVRAWSIGIKDGNRDYLKKGAVKALDYLLAEYLSEIGYKKIHMGASRAFLKDGVLQRKRGIGLKLVDHSTTYMALRIALNTKGVQSFLLNNPFIVESNGNYHGTVFYDGESTPTTEEVESICKDHAIPGMHHLSIRSASTMKEEFNYYL